MPWEKDPRCGCEFLAPFRDHCTNHAKHEDGHTEGTDSKIECPACGKFIHFADNDYYLDWWRVQEDGETLSCPFCDADIKLSCRVTVSVEARDAAAPEEEEEEEADGV